MNTELSNNLVNSLSLHCPTADIVTSVEDFNQKLLEFYNVVLLRDVIYNKLATFCEFSYNGEAIPPEELEKQNINLITYNNKYENSIVHNISLLKFFCVKSLVKKQIDSLKSRLSVDYSLTYRLQAQEPKNPFDVRFIQPHQKSMTMEQFHFLHNVAEYVITLHIPLVFISTAVTHRIYAKKKNFYYQLEEENQYFRINVPIDVTFEELRDELLRQLKNQGIILPSLMIFQGQFSNSTTVRFKEEAMLEPDDSIAFYLNMTSIVLVAMYNMEYGLAEDEDSQLVKESEEYKCIQEVEQKCDMITHNINEVLFRSRKVKIRWKRQVFQDAQCLQLPCDHVCELVIYPFQSVRVALDYLSTLLGVPSYQLYLESVDQDVSTLEDYHSLMSSHTTFMNFDSPNGTTLEVKPLVHLVHSTEIEQQQLIDYKVLHCVTETVGEKEISFSKSFWNSWNQMVEIWNKSEQYQLLETFTNVNDVYNYFGWLMNCFFTLHQQLYTSPITVVQKGKKQVLHTLDQFIDYAQKHYNQHQLTNTLKESYTSVQPTIETEQQNEINENNENNEATREDYTAFLESTTHEIENDEEVEIVTCQPPSSSSIEQMYQYSKNGDIVINNEEYQEFDQESNNIYQDYKAMTVLNQRNTNYYNQKYEDETSTDEEIEQFFRDEPKYTATNLSQTTKDLKRSVAEVSTNSDDYNSLFIKRHKPI